MALNKYKKLDQIVNDNQSGSSAILANLQFILLNNFNDFDFVNKSVEEMDRRLSHFAVLKNFSFELKKVLKKKDPEQIRIFIKNSILKQKAWIESLYQKHRKLFLKFHTVTTLSHSNTLLKLFKVWKEDFGKIHVYILESRPKLEGRKSANELTKIGIICTLITDAMMAYAVKQSNAVLIGADQLLKNGNVINKSGSLPLASCAKEFKKPFYVITCNDKSIKSNKYLPLQSPTEEVWNISTTKMKIKNYYFEEVPSYLITKILS